MKKNLYLLAVLLVLLAVTFFLTEEKIFEEKTIADDIQHELQHISVYTINGVEIKQIDQEWRLTSGELDRVDFLNEFHEMFSSIQQLKLISKKIKEEYFQSTKLVFKLNQKEFTLGDMTSDNLSCYIADGKTQKVYLLELEKMASKVMGQDEQSLQQEKYRHLKEFLSLTKNELQERRLYLVLRLPSFNQIKLGDKLLDLTKLSQDEQGKTTFKMLESFMVSFTGEKVVDKKMMKEAFKLVFLLNGKEQESWTLDKNAQGMTSKQKISFSTDLALSQVEESWKNIMNSVRIKP